jgi:hypothetical protein
MSKGVISGRDISAFIRQMINTIRVKSVEDFPKEELDTLQRSITEYLKKNGYEVSKNTIDLLEPKEKDELIQLFMNFVTKDFSDDGGKSTSFSKNQEQQLSQTVKDEKEKADKKVEYYGPVTYLSDQPDRSKNEKKWNEWYSKLDENEHEILRERGEDPYDPWR